MTAPYVAAALVRANFAAHAGAAPTYAVRDDLR